MSDLKQQAAREAARLIGPGDTIGLGAGSTMMHLIDAIKETAGLSASIRIVTSSFAIRQRLLTDGFIVLDSGWISRVHWYFDGCDQFDRRLNALKSGGGIHATEKVLAAMADKFILVGDLSKRVERFDARYPLVIEVIPEALAYVSDRIKKFFNPSKSELRLSAKKDGAVITERGNFLIDNWFETFPEPAMLNERVIAIPGILEHSLFYNMAHRAITAGPDGIQIFTKP
jgi:ribose 5-phosphate isomerase A